MGKPRLLVEVLKEEARARVRERFLDFVAFARRERFSDWIPEFERLYRDKDDGHVGAVFYLPTEPGAIAPPAQFRLREDGLTTLWVFGIGEMPMRTADGDSLPSCAAFRILLRRCSDGFPVKADRWLAYFTFYIRSLHEFATRQPEPYDLPLPYGLKLREDLQDLFIKLDGGKRTKEYQVVLSNYPSAL